MQTPTFHWCGRDTSSLTHLLLMYPDTWCHDNTLAAPKATRLRLKIVTHHYSMHHPACQKQHKSLAGCEQENLSSLYTSMCFTSISLHQSDFQLNSWLFLRAVPGEFWNGTLYVSKIRTSLCVSDTDCVTDTLFMEMKPHLSQFTYRFRTCLMKWSALSSHSVDLYTSWL